MILVTGANGFLGRAVVQELIAAGHRLRALVVPEEDTTFLAALPQVEIVRGDVTQAGTLDGVCDGVETVVHLAGVVGSSDETLNFTVNFVGTRNLADVAERAGVRKVVFVSSITAGADRPNTYGLSKRIAEEYLARKPFVLVIVRPTFVYGRGGASFERLVAMARSPSRILPIIGRGDARKQPVFVDDAARVLARATTFERGGVYELGGPEAVPFTDLVARVVHGCGARKRLVHVPRWIVWAALSVAERVTRRLPITRDGLKELENSTSVDHTLIERVFDVHLRSLDDGIRRSV